MSIRGGKISKELLLFDLPDTGGDAAAPERKGRDAALIERRNERLFHRYVYHRLDNPKWAHEYLVEQIAEEFDLSTSTVGQLIEANAGELVRIRREFPTVKELRDKWPWMVWK